MPNKLNIWIATLNFALLGYSTFPWHYKTKPDVDGVVISSNVSGMIFKGENLPCDYTPFNLYKTFTHETSHYCGLLHVFEDELDFDPVTQSKDANGGEDFVAEIGPEIGPWGLNWRPVRSQPRPARLPG